RRCELFSARVILTLTVEWPSGFTSCFPHRIYSFWLPPDILYTWMSPKKCPPRSLRAGKFKPKRLALANHLALAANDFLADTDGTCGRALTITNRRKRCAIWSRTIRNARNCFSGSLDTATGSSTFQ